MAEQNKKKTSWLKRLLKIFIGLIIVLIALVIGIYLSLNIIVKKAITTAVPPITGTTVNVDDIDLSLLKGHISMTGFKIGNPGEFTTPSIFELGSIVVNFDPKSILTDKIIIKNIAINHTTASAEINKRGEINVMLIQQNVENYLNKTKTTPAPKAEANKKDSAGSSKKVVIKDLTINNTKLNLAAVGQVITINLPTIHKTGIGEENGKQRTLPETIALILSYFSEASITGVMNSGNQLFMQSLQNTKAMLQQGKAILDKQLDNVKGQVDNVKQIGTDITDSVKNVGDSVKGLGNMFKK